MRVTLTRSEASETMNAYDPKLQPSRKLTHCERSIKHRQRASRDILNGSGFQFNFLERHLVNCLFYGSRPKSPRRAHFAKVAVFASRGEFFLFSRCHLGSLESDRDFYQRRHYGSKRILRGFVWLKAKFIIISLPLFAQKHALLFAAAMIVGKRLVS